MVELPGKAGEGFETLEQFALYIPPAALSLRWAAGRTPAKGGWRRIKNRQVKSPRVVERHDLSGRRAIRAALSSVLVDGAT
jgi:hypothetical protein